MSAGDVLLVRFAWGDPEPGAVLRAAAPETALRFFRSLDGAAGYAYVDAGAEASVPDFAAALSAMLPRVVIVHLQALLELDGATAGRDAPYRYVVETDVLAEREPDFNAWYDEEHLAGLAAVPGTVRAARYRDPAGHPRYHACYDLVSHDVLRSAAWLAVRGTPWSSRVRPAFVDTKRTVFRRQG